MVQAFPELLQGSCISAGFCHWSMQAKAYCSEKYLDWCAFYVVASSELAAVSVSRQRKIFVTVQGGSELLRIFCFVGNRV